MGERKRDAGFGAITGLTAAGFSKGPNIHAGRTVEGGGDCVSIRRAARYHQPPPAAAARRTVTATRNPLPVASRVGSRGPPSAGGFHRIEPVSLVSSGAAVQLVRYMPA